MSHGQDKKDEAYRDKERDERDTDERKERKERKKGNIEKNAKNGRKERNTNKNTMPSVCGVSLLRFGRNWWKPWAKRKRSKRLMASSLK